VKVAVSGGMGLEDVWDAGDSPAEETALVLAEPAGAAAQPLAITRTQTMISQFGRAIRAV
jgi:hypothetical protein